MIDLVCYIKFLPGKINFMSFFFLNIFTMIEDDNWEFWGKKINYFIELQQLNDEQEKSHLGKVGNRDFTICLLFLCLNYSLICCHVCCGKVRTFVYCTCFCDEHIEQRKKNEWLHEEVRMRIERDSFSSKYFPTSVSLGVKSIFKRTNVT